MLDHHIFASKPLHPAHQPDTMNETRFGLAMKRDTRQRTFSDFPLSPRTFFPQNHMDVISGGDEACTTTSLGKNEHGVVITTQRFSSPRREVHRGRPNGSAANAPFGSNASITPFAAMNATACGAG
jgi:hypothetical protein